MTPRRRFDDDSGLTLAEVLVSSILMAVVGTLILSGFTNGHRLFRATSAETDGQTDVRTTIERLGRDIRESRSLDPGASPSQLVLWIDGNSDYKKQAAEVVTWTLAATTEGHFDVTRLQDGQARRQSRLIISQLAFCYRLTALQPCLATPLTADQAATVRVVSSDIVYDAVVDSGTTSRRAQFAERLRNVS